MITRPASRSYICLSCRRSLAKRKVPLASQVARQSTDSSLHHVSEQASAEQPQDDTPPVSNGNVIRRAFGRGSVVSSHPLGRLHGHRGVKLRENLEKLQTTSLGEAAKVIVLRDSGYSVYESSNDELKAQEAQHIDILGQLEDERGLIGQEEVNENINACRPKVGEGPGTWDEINVLVRRLQDGFTIPQLERYIEVFEGRQVPEIPPAEWVTDEEKAPILRITPWQPGVSDITDHFDNDPLRGYFLESHTAKQRVILRLLRECWMLQLPELEQGIGQFEIQVHHDDLGVLLLGPFSVLDSIHAEHLVLDDETLEVFLSRSVIRVTTTHFKKNLIVKAVEEALKGLEKQTLAIGDLYPLSLGKPNVGKVQRWAQRNFDDNALRELGRLTSTSISRKPKHRILISSIGNKSDALSSKNDAATRLLLTSGNFSDRVVYQLAYHQPNSRNAALISHPCVEELPWRERLRDWTRWTSPISKEKHETNKHNLKMAPSILLSTPSRFQENSTPMKTPREKSTEADDGLAYWASDLFTETSVLVGSVIHSNIRTPTQLRPTPPERLADDHFLHSFSTFVPNISRVLSKSSFWQHNKNPQQLVLRFQPNPFYVPPTLEGKGTNSSIGALALSAFPPVEMIFDIVDDDLKSAKLKHVQAIVNESKTDVMLPDNAVDLRFQQRTTSRLKRRYIDQVRGFLKKSKLSLQGAEALETPPSITLPISSPLCHEPGFKIFDGQHRKSKSSKPDKNIREVEYLFTGLEVRHTLAFQYRGWLLQYTSVEAGRAGGRRGELRIRPSKNKEVATEKDFVRMAYKLAHILGGEGENGYATKEIRKVEVSDGKDSLVRRMVTRESKVDTVFRYFGMRPSEFSGKRGVEEKGWEERERVDEEIEDDDEGEESESESEGDQGAGSVKSDD